MKRKIAFCVMIMGALIGCDDSSSSGNDESNVLASSAVLASSSSPAGLSSSDLGSSSAVVELSSSASLSLTFTLSPKFGSISQSLLPGNWTLSYSSACTQGTLVLTGVPSGASCDAVVSGINFKNMEMINMQGRPSQITLNSTCTAYCM